MQFITSEQLITTRLPSIDKRESVQRAGVTTDRSLACKPALNRLIFLKFP